MLPANDDTPAEGVAEVAKETEPPEALALGVGLELESGVLADFAEGVPGVEEDVTEFDTNAAEGVFGGEEDVTEFDADLDTGDDDDTGKLPEEDAPGVLDDAFKGEVELDTD